ncbi:MAG: PEGA domain-containing protein [Meiothermus ruber]|uniref:PEGA domain-containing protein n=1 Tax=Meiothermus ruber TaxID=277 RepID=UPI0017A0CC6A|nr:PEGA domain-containing protein [Meiothermus ruber]MCL6531017.1 PEGA domain-containing protein [Meiothermus ruber]MCX7801489.1 PEGA domain-containing protein [Meiothermus ruber]
MNALLLWILGILGVLIMLWGLTRLPRGGLAWLGFGLVLGLAGLGGAWLHQQYGTTIFWGLGILGVLLLVWALLNLRSRLAGWSAGLAVLLVLTGFGSIVLLNSSSPNLLTSGTIPNPLNNFQTDPGSAPDGPTTNPTPPAETTPEPTPTPPETDPSQPATEPSPSPAEPAPTAPVASGSVREVDPACPCLLSVRVKAPNPTVRILQDGTEVASSKLEYSSFSLEAGDYTLQVEAPGYRTLSTLINVPRNKNLEVELAQ